MSQQKRSKSTLYYVSIPGVNMSITKENVYKQLDVHAYQLVVCAYQMQKLNCQDYRLAVNFKNKKNGNEVIQLLQSIFTGLSRNKISLPQMKDFASAAKKATEIDTKPLHKDACVDDFSVTYKDHRFAAGNDSYNVDDAYVICHSNRRNFLFELHKTYWYKNFVPVPVVPCKVLQRFGDWRDDVVAWFNDYVGKEWQYKKPQLYLWGPPSTGKSTFIQQVLLAQYGCQVYTMLSSDAKYAWECFDSHVHKLVLMDEFDIRDFDRNQLKLALAGDRIMVPTKYKDAQLKQIRTPIVMISNYAPPCELEGFKERVKVVNTAPHENQKLGPVVNFFEYLDLWQHQPCHIVYKGTTVDICKISDIFDKKEYRDKIDNLNKSNLNRNDNGNLSREHSRSSISIVRSNETLDYDKQVDIATTTIEAPLLSSTIISSSYSPSLISSRCFSFKKQEVNKNKTVNKSIPTSTQLLKPNSACQTIDDYESEDDFVIAKKKRKFDSGIESRVNNINDSDTIHSTVEETDVENNSD
jgi:hypothetical protein